MTVKVLARMNRIVLGGHPEKTNAAKRDITSLQIVSKTRSLEGREVNTVVGKAGSTINNLSEKYCVVMEISKVSGSSNLRVIGVLVDVDAALKEVNSLLYQNEEVEEAIVVNQMLRGELLNNSGAGIKEFQYSVSNAIGIDHSVSLVLERNTAKDAVPSLLIKCNREVMARVKSLVQKKVDEFETNTITINVPSEIIPSIIGKGGAKINSLRQEGAGGALIEAESRTETVKIHSRDKHTREIIRTAIEQIVADNQVGYVSIEKASIGFMFGEPGKDMREKLSEIGCNISINENETKVVIKGRNESVSATLFTSFTCLACKTQAYSFPFMPFNQIAKATEILEAFIKENHIAELDIHPDDEPLLFIGGDNSIQHQVETKHGVKVNFRKDKSVVHIRGEAEKTSEALKELDTYLSGGEGVAVIKFKIPEGAIGAVVGKGGANITKLETDFEGVRVYVPRDSTMVSIRGPDDLVKQCKVSLITSIATARVGDNIDISPEQYADLSNSDTIRRFAGATNTSIVLNESSIKIRGVGNDVRDAKALFTEKFTGVFTSFVDLDASHCARLKSAIAKDSSHFERIHLSTGADVTLKTEDCAIQITGKKSNVKKAKASLMHFLDFMFPHQFQTVKVHKTLFKSMGDAGRLAEIAAATGSSVCLDRDLISVLVRSECSDASAKAVVLLNARLAECEKLNAVIKFESSDAWLLSVIIGKKGSTIKELESESSCTFDVLKDELTVVVSAERKEMVVAGKASLDAIVDKARKECIFVDIPESAMSAFIGKGGSHIKQLAEDNEVVIERVKKQSSVMKITGPEHLVENAKAAVLSWLKDWEASHVGLTIEVEEQLIPVVLGKGGETIRALQKETGCRIDIDRHHLTVTVRDGKESDREVAMNRVKAIIDEEQAKAAERAVEMEKLKQERAAEAEQTKAQSASELASKDVLANESGTKDRTTEFVGRRPVGLTKSKGNSGSNNTAIEVGTKEGRELFQMLISGNETNPDDQWDSSTVSSSAAMISVCGSNENGEKHYRSISGFTVRI